MHEKEQSNPFSMGGGGVNFETRVQAAFAILMLTGGLAPCITKWPIKKIKLQGKYADYNTDDFIIFTKNPKGDGENKLLAQIKHTISITEGNTTFGEVIYSAWRDFCNPQLFNPEIDAIALITGPLSAYDIENARTILEWARYSENANDYLTKIEKANFSSEQKRLKLNAFRFHLNKANGQNVSDDQLWKFMKSFHVLGYDLDIKAGVTLSLLQSLINQYSPDDTQKLWLQVVDEVQAANQNAGTLDINKFPQEVRDIFKEKAKQTIPEDFIAKDTPTVVVDLSMIQYSSELAIAALLGAWNETNSNDKRIIEQLFSRTYSEWITIMRKVLLLPGTQLIQKDNKWEIPERLHILGMFEKSIFDEHLDRFKQITISVLRERDSKFDLPPEQRYAASIYGKVLSHSQLLRKGLAETLALLGSYSKLFTSCSIGKAETTAILTIREIFSDADWVLWTSLNDLLPLFVEAAPREFLKIVENTLNNNPGIFDKIFSQEGSGIMGSNYMTGLLWALESLAWDSEYLIRVIVLLGELASRDPGGNWANRPINSMIEILLPWFPQTCAPLIKRKTALEILISESPKIAWQLLLSLLPKAHQTSTGTHKPKWRNLIDENYKSSVTKKEYWDQIEIYADLAFNMAKIDLMKLAELIESIDDLPQNVQDRILSYLESNEVLSKSEEEKFILWCELVKIISKHRKFADAEWAMNSTQINKATVVAEHLAPNSSRLKYKHLFGKWDINLFEEKGNYQEQRKKLDELRDIAIQDIFDSEGLLGVLEFVKLVDNPWKVGYSLGTYVVDDNFILELSKYLENENKSFESFASGYVWGRINKQGWQWVDEISTTNWSASMLGKFLICLPFKLETWNRVELLLGENESAYWEIVSVNPYEPQKDINIAIDNLIKYKRSNAAIECLNAMLHEGQPVDNQRIVKALIAELNSSERLNTYDICELIKALQDDPTTNSDELFRIEWSYLPILERENDASPILLEQRLADDPEFFCEVIRIVYRSRKENVITEELSEQRKNIAENAYRLLHNWRIPPGCKKDGTFDSESLNEWMNYVKTECKESGHLETALITVGHVLKYSPPDPDGLWIHKTVAKLLNEKDAEYIREGFRTELFNSRGVFSYSAGKEEIEIAKNYRSRADDVESQGFHRLAYILKELAGSYEREAEGEASRDINIENLD